MTSLEHMMHRLNHMYMIQGCPDPF